MDDALAQILIFNQIPAKLCELLKISLNDQKIQRKVFKTIQTMLERDDFFSARLTEEFKSKTDLLSICESSKASCEGDNDKQSDKLYSAVFNVNKYLQD